MLPGITLQKKPASAIFQANDSGTLFKDQMRSGSISAFSRNTDQNKHRSGAVDEAGVNLEASGTSHRGLEGCKKLWIEEPITNTPL